MHFRDILNITRGTKVILAITSAVSALAVIFAFFYYRSINRSEDPRIHQAREYLLRFDQTSGSSNGFEAFCLLDSANAIFMSLPDYQSSFETGLIFNNKSSSLLLLALYDSAIDRFEKTNLLSLSMSYCDSSISVYQRWNAEWGSLTPAEIETKIRPLMGEDHPAFKGMNYNRILKRRIKYISTAQIETPRRLSVSLSNKGTIYRHMMKLDSSLICYKKALSIWKNNRTAKSNMSVLMGGEVIRPSVIESLFPPDRNKQ